MNQIKGIYRFVELKLNIARARGITNYLMGELILFKKFYMNRHIFTEVDVLISLEPYQILWELDLDHVPSSYIFVRGGHNWLGSLLAY